MPQYTTHLNSMPKGTFLYVFNKGLAEAYPEEMIQPTPTSIPIGPERDAKRKENKLRLQNIMGRKPINIFVKTGADEWLDYNQFIRLHQVIAKENLKKDITTSYVGEPNVVVPIEVLPKCVYMDENYIVHYIAPFDGASSQLEKCSKKFIDTIRDIDVDWGYFDTYTRVFTPLSTYTLNKKDARLTGTDVADGNVVVTVNGFFKRAYFTNNAIHIKDAIQHNKFFYNKLGNGKNILDHQIDVYKWNNVQISYNNMLLVDTAIKRFYYHNGTEVKKVTYPKYITFAEDWDHNKMVLVIDGEIVDNSLYNVVDNNPKKLDITPLMENILKDYHKYYNSIGEQIDVFTVNKFLTINTFAFKFSSGAAGKELRVFRDTNIIYNKPQRGAIAFNDQYAEDNLLIVNGRAKRDIVSLSNGSFRFQQKSDVESMFPKLTDVEEVAPYNYLYTLDDNSVEYNNIEAIRFLLK